MSLPGLSISRHVFAYMVSALIVLFGIIAFRDIGVDQYPQVDLPMVSVTTVLPGADPEIIDTSITNVIENAVNSVPGIDVIPRRVDRAAAVPARKGRGCRVQRSAGQGQSDAAHAARRC
jgi:Cu/Ag efflux pump CusA